MVIYSSCRPLLLSSIFWIFILNSQDEGIGLAVLADQQPMAVDECDDPESEVDYVPLTLRVSVRLMYFRLNRVMIL